MYFWPRLWTSGEIKLFKFTIISLFSSLNISVLEIRTFGVKLNALGLPTRLVH